MHMELKLSLYDLISGSQEADIRDGKQNFISRFSIEFPMESGKKFLQRYEG